MHILILSDFFPNKTVPHEGIVVLQLIKELKKSAEITLFAPRITYPPFQRYRSYRRDFSHFPELESYQIKTIFLNYYHIPVLGEWIAPYWFLAKMILILKIRKIDFDLIHANWAYRSGFWGSWIKKIFRKKLILTVHGSDINLWLNEKIKGDRIRSALRNADIIIGVSEYLLNKISHLTDGKTFWIPNGVDSILFCTNPKKKKETIKILCVANHYFIKGVDILIHAAVILKTKIDDFTISLVGDGPERVYLEHLTNELDLKNVIRFCGHVPNNQVAEYLKESNLLVVPSRNEGWGMVILEALSAGVPVVASKVGGIPEVLQDGKYGILVQPESPIRLAEAIETAIEKKWQEQELRHYATQFSWSRIAEETLSKYQKVLD
jgi:teichuronic acid biosynthesis glycosyltransferase TuaC